MLELKNTQKFVQQFNNIANQDTWTEEETDLMSLWKTILAMSLVKDFGFGLASDVADVINSIVLVDGD